MGFVRLEMALTLHFCLAAVLPPATSNLLQFANMIQKYTGRPSSVYYYGYGCWCGKGGRGQPKDETDWCCQKHDCCYGVLETMGCKIYFDTYHFKIEDKNITCGGGTPCQRLLCNCDMKATICFENAFRNWHLKYRTILDFLCPGPSPTCGQGIVPAQG
ncbi:basic phospholipase A2-like [Rhinatrema bivittatum]|uniref:basic phospholipase A2-like n=1 Tax=Rhinatrema bivittatum TaxID=194408 RepID=UPI00112BF31F|nr:basic phospholipase A2-like [Rhinatrema bivittatum]